MTVRGTLIKVADPEKGLSRGEYEAICTALGIKPNPPATTSGEARPTDAEASGEQPDI